MKRLFIAVVLALIALVTAPLAAYADHSTNPNTAELAHIVTSHDGDSCGEASVTLTVPEGTPDWNYRLQVEVDGEIVGSTDLVNGPGSSTFQLVFEEDQSDGEVDVRYYFLDAEEWDIVDPAMDRSSVWPAVGDAFVAFAVDTDCEPDPDPTTEPTSEPTSEPTAEPTETKAPAAVPTSVPAGLPAGSWAPVNDVGPDFAFLIPLGAAIVVGIVLAVAGAIVFNRTTSKG